MASAALSSHPCVPLRPRARVPARRWSARWRASRRRARSRDRSGGRRRLGLLATDRARRRCSCACAQWSLEPRGRGYARPVARGAQRPAAAPAQEWAPDPPVAARRSPPELKAAPRRRSAPHCPRPPHQSYPAFRRRCRPSRSRLTPGRASMRPNRRSSCSRPSSPRHACLAQIDRATHHENRDHDEHERHRVALHCRARTRAQRSAALGATMSAALAEAPHSHSPRRWPPPGVAGTVAVAPPHPSTFPESPASARACSCSVLIPATACTIAAPNSFAC